MQSHKQSKQILDIRMRLLCFALPCPALSTWAAVSAPDDDETVTQQHSMKPEQDANCEGCVLLLLRPA